MKCLLLDILSGKPQREIPVWLMRQAGRYMPEYRELKSQHGFLGLCRNPQLATEITMQPIKRFRPDAAIIFADIMLPASCLGFDIEFAPGPVVAKAVREPAQIADLPDTFDCKEVAYVFEAISQVREELQAHTSERGRIGLFGFAAAPWTMACYLIAQEPYKHFAGTSVFAAKHPLAFADFLAKIRKLTLTYCLEQLRAGADVIQLFDSWSGVLSAHEYERIAFAETQKLIAELAAVAPVILYVNGSSHLLPLLSQTNATGFSLDWRIELSRAAELVPDRVLQGNLDPALLFQKPEALDESIATMLNQAPQGRYIANLGHGVLQQTPMEQVQRFISAIQAVQ